MISGTDRIDLHMHTTVSDGTDTPEELLAFVREAKLGLFSVTDHDAVKGCRSILAIRKPDDPLFLCGVEFSCKDEEGQYHILGYGYDPDAEPINAAVEHGHTLRMNKLKKRLAFLEERFGFTFTPEETDTLYATDNPGKPHIANMMVQHGYTESRGEAIEKYLSQAKFPSEYVRPEEAIEGIRLSGGIPVLAHPCYGNGDQLILGDALTKRVEKLMGFGLLGLEAFYSGFPKKLIDEVLSLADRFGLYVTAGSDYHGRNKPLIVIGDTGLSQVSDAPDALKRFLDAVSDRI